MSKKQQTELALVGGAAPAQAPSPAPTPAPSPVQSYDIPADVDEFMVTILSWPRSHNSPAELAFGAWLRNHLEVDLGHTVKMHAEGAMSVTIPRTDGKPSAVLFSCHIDTVDLDADSQIGKTKKLVYDPNFGHICLDTSADAPKFDCLGADDGAGIWIMLVMIASGKPGTYLFHRGEECGCVSAKAIAKQDKAWLETFDIALAFDRPRDNEVITHQGGVRCASDKAAKALCKALNDQGLFYEPSDRGAYTDTKEYRGAIAECFNLGVGYTQQHSSRETLDYAFCAALALAAIEVDWDTLPVDRKPELTEPYYSNFGSWRGHGGYARWDDADDLSGWGDSKSRAPTPAPAPSTKKTVTLSPYEATLRWALNATIEDLLETANAGEFGELVNGFVTLVREVKRLRADSDYLSDLVDDAVYNGLAVH